jgi:glycosyltransferase involved in cell wall biosynthesis
LIGKTMKVLASALGCAAEGKSESYVGHQWVRQIARYADVTVLTADKRAVGMADARPIVVQPRLMGMRKLSRTMFGAIKPHYFSFDRQVTRRFAAELGQYDVFHHIVPIAPRYPSGLGSLARRFVLGPVGGGLRVPLGLRREVEQAEPGYAWLRNLDRARFRMDPALRRTYDRCDVLILAAEYMRRIIPERYQRRGVEVLLETGIDPDEYHACTPERPTRDTVRLLYVGRVVPYKGLQFLIRAMAAVGQHVRANLHLTVVGDASSAYGRTCKEMAQALKLSGQVEFLGRLSKSAVQRIYGASDIFCFPTLAETSGNVILEAMASGLPVVTVDYGGPGEIVNESCGVLADPGSASHLIESLADGIARLASDKARRLQLGAIAQARAFTKFSWDYKGDRIAKIYSTLV